jgi:hypothetical protein
VSHAFCWRRRCGAAVLCLVPARSPHAAATTLLLRARGAHHEIVHQTPEPRWSRTTREDLRTARAHESPLTTRQVPRLTSLPRREWRRLGRHPEVLFSAVELERGGDRKAESRIVSDTA